jgi:hypothetical protein
VAQDHAVDEDVQLAAVGDVPEEQALAPVQRVELAVGLVASSSRVCVNGRTSEYRVARSRSL